jgi:ribonuclease R
LSTKKAVSKPVSPKSRGRGKLSLREQDPFLERERTRYEHPLPSREWTLQVLTEQGRPLQSDELIQLLDIRSDEQDVFQRRMNAMERDGQIMVNRKGQICLPDKLALIRGRVEGHPEGFGFVVPDDGSPDLFLSPREMHQVMHGDKVLAKEAGLDRRGRREGKIVEVLDRAQNRVVGRYYQEKGVGFVVAENRRINQDILIPTDQTGNASHGQVVTVEMVSPPTKYSEPVGRIIEVLGSYADPGMEIEIALRKHALPFEFSPAAEAQAKALPKKVLKKDWADREDITGLPLVTIDGETARDFDDAVYCEPEGNGFRLIVAIADVSHYVQPKDGLDQDAYERGNSVYFPRRVIPMLPEELSNGLCSLNPKVERLCMVCDMVVGQQGAIKSYRFYPAVMFSHARLTYTQVWSWLSGEEKPGKEHLPLLPQLKNLEDVFSMLLKARERRGAIDFESVETRMIFDDQGKITRIEPVVRNEAHRLIEECMLAANVCASDLLRKKKTPALYRIHEGPTPEKLEALQQFLAEFGLTMPGGDEPKAKDYARLIEQIKPRPDAQLLQTVMLRSLRQAVYSPDNVGHFGLAYEQYTHFTSPIRRYPDLLIHRAIKSVLSGEKAPQLKLDVIGAHCSVTERRADDASRDVETWLKTYYMREHLGSEFWGTVSSVTSFGLFVALDGVFVEGLVHISELGQDYFRFDPAKHWLLGERTGQRFRLGDRLRVKVVRADIESSKIDFVLVEETGQDVLPGKAKSRKPGSAKPARKRD